MTKGSLSDVGLNFHVYFARSGFKGQIVFPIVSP